MRLGRGRVRVGAAMPAQPHQRKVNGLALEGKDAGDEAAFLAGDPISLGVLMDDESCARRRGLLG